MFLLNKACICCLQKHPDNILLQHAEQSMYYLVRFKDLLLLFITNLVRDTFCSHSTSYGEKGNEVAAKTIIRKAMIES